MSRYRRAAPAWGHLLLHCCNEAASAHLVIGPVVRLALREVIVSVRQPLPFKVDGWVLRPDHLHEIWTLPEGDADFSNRRRLIKRYVTRACGPGYLRPEFLAQRRTVKKCGTLWQHRFLGALIRDDRLSAIHGLPARQSGEAWACWYACRLAVVFVPSLGSAWRLSCRLGWQWCSGCLARC